MWDVHGIEHGDDEGHGPAETTHEDGTSTSAGLEPEVTSLLVTYRSAFGAVRVPRFVNRQTELQAAVPAIETTRLLSLLGVGIDTARVFAWLIALTGGLSIFVALLNAASAREGDLALLRVMGATRSAVFGTILIEGLLTALAGALLGIVLGHGTLALAAASFERLAKVGLQPFRFHPGELAIAGAVLAIGAAAALVLAIQVFRTDLARTLARAA